MQYASEQVRSNLFGQKVPCVKNCDPRQSQRSSLHPKAVTRLPCDTRVDVFSRVVLVSMHSRCRGSLTPVRLGVLTLLGELLNQRVLSKLFSYGVVWWQVLSNLFGQKMPYDKRVDVYSYGLHTHTHTHTHIRTHTYIYIYC